MGQVCDENTRFRKSYIFGQSETVSIYLVILKMQFLVQFQVKIFACFTMFGIEAISNLSILGQKLNKKAITGLFKPRLICQRVLGA